MAVTKNELREKELLKHFRHLGTWLVELVSKNKWVNNDTIKLNDIGADPEVLINNNTYPIPTTGREDGEKVISLEKYDTTNTEVTDDELYGLPYDKIGSSQQQHRETLEEKTIMKSLHSISPFENTTDTIVIETTGVDDGTGRKRMTMADLISLRKKYNDLKIPAGSRILVLSNEHAADLMLADVAFNNRMLNHSEGKPAPMLYGFKIYESTYSPLYDDANKQKKAFAALPSTNDRVASVACYTKRAARATGSAKAFMRMSKDDPENRKTVLGFRLYHIAIPLSLKGQGAIIDGRV